MKFRVMLTLTFDEEEDAMDLWEKIKDTWNDTPRLEDDHANVHRCYHDENPVKPCEIIEEL